MHTARIPHPTDAQVRAQELAVVARIRSLFGGLWGFDDPEDAETRAAMQDALEHPEDYVLKPQREGGGNNLWGPAMQEVLRRADFQGELPAYILMERFHPPRQPSIMMRLGQLLEAPEGRRSPHHPFVVETTQELGIYGWILGGSRWPSLASAASGGVSVGPAVQQPMLGERKHGEDEGVFTSRFAGHLVRTKLTGVDEGGIASGFAVLDTPVLVPDLADP